MAEQAEPWQQEIRLAMTMVGGASLAIWMGGVATETSQLLRESRGDAEAGLYRGLLDLLRATVSIDVLTGTSAAWDQRGLPRAGGGVRLDAAGAARHLDPDRLAGEPHPRPGGDAAAVGAGRRPRAAR